MDKIHEWSIGSNWDKWNLGSCPKTQRQKYYRDKWVFNNKLNQYGQVIRNKEILVCKGYAQVEGIDFEETYAFVERIEEIRMFLAFACHKNFKVYQMDVKSVFLNGKIEEDVYIEQP